MWKGRFTLFHKQIRGLHSVSELFPFNLCKLKSTHSLTSWKLNKDKCVTQFHEGNLKNKFFRVNDFKILLHCWCIAEVSSSFHTGFDGRIVVIIWREIRFHYPCKILIFAQERDSYSKFERNCLNIYFIWSIQIEKWNRS